MAELKQITIERDWGLLLVNLGIQPDNLLRRAKLPLQLLDKDPVRVSLQEYFSLWSSLAEESQNPELPLQIGEILKNQKLSPLLFAALSCPDLTSALKRVSQFKRVVTQLHMQVEVREHDVTVFFNWDNPVQLTVPPLLLLTELVTLIHISRLGTGKVIVPKELTYPELLITTPTYENFFGAPIRFGPQASITFSKEDASQPFHTTVDSLWAKFEPELQNKPEEPKIDRHVSKQVRSMLISCLPAGEASIDDVARRLRTSRRTLQRQLKSEGTIFRTILQEIREHFAMHYLVKTSISYSEIALLLGFHEPSSFFRAFRSWKNTTPESARLNRTPRNRKYIETRTVSEPLQLKQIQDKTEIIETSHHLRLDAQKQPLHDSLKPLKDSSQNGPLLSRIPCFS